MTLLTLSFFLFWEAMPYRSRTPDVGHPLSLRSSAISKSNQTSGRKKPVQAHLAEFRKSQSPTSPVRSTRTGSRLAVHTGRCRRILILSAAPRRILNTIQTQRANTATAGRRKPVDQVVIYSAGTR